MLVQQYLDQAILLAPELSLNDDWLQICAEFLVGHQLCMVQAGVLLVVLDEYVGAVLDQ